MNTKRRFKIDKLIRDKIPTIFEAENVDFKYRTMDEAEYQRSLKAKLFEEAQEVLETENITDLKEELADVLEVFQALIKAFGFSYEEIEILRAQKKEFKGGFDHRLHGICADYANDHPLLHFMLEKCEKNPEKYSELPFSISEN